MALVTHIIGDCPACGHKDSYGNVTVGRDTLMRGCLSCRHWDQISLPALNKKVLYLDQYFYSHAFRGEHKGFFDAKEKISALSIDQLIVSPYSNFHEDETLLWTPEQRDPLMKFIKQTSGGHKFWPGYHVKEMQITDAFSRFLSQTEPTTRINRADAIPNDVNKWDNYFWFDVGSFKTDSDALRSGKNEAVRSLMELFSGWAQKPSTFENDVTAELRGSRDSYIRMYMEYVKRIGDGDYNALLDSPIDSSIVEKLMRYGDERLTADYKMQRIREFFDSVYFANVPYERISSEFFALLRHRLRQGNYRNTEKTGRRFKGFFYDVSFIATYAPYCDAMVVDSSMHSWATDPLIDLPRRYGIRIFSRRNWPAFLEYLDELDISRTEELKAALQMVRPPHAKHPDWSAILKR